MKDNEPEKIKNLRYRANAVGVAALIFGSFVVAMLLPKVKFSIERLTIFDRVILLILFFLLLWFFVYVVQYFFEKWKYSKEQKEKEDGV